MSNLTIRTNNRPRDALYWHELSPAEQAEFSYLDSEEKRESARFGRYRGQVYDLCDMERDLSLGLSASMPAQFHGWDDFLSDSYFSGILIRWIDNCERVIFARYSC